MLGVPEYLKQRRKEDYQKIIARFGCGMKTYNSNFWKK